MTLNRLTTLCVLLMASVWVALVNGQPLFMADTSAYVRGPDFSIVHFFGKAFATSWTQERTLASDAHSGAAASKPAAKDLNLNSPYDKAVLAGRSIYYGALLYAGHLTSDFWLSVFVQAVLFLYLTYTLSIKCLRLSFLTFTCATAVTIVATPASFFISFLMPDVFASLLFMATLILAGFWDALTRSDRIVTSAIILLSILAHTSHLLLLAALTILFVVFSLFRGRTLVPPRSTLIRTAVLFALLLSGVVGEMIFTYAARHIVSADPVRPPFLVARLIADGPGYQFLVKNCPEAHYAACNYIDRMPSRGEAFLWSTNPKSGVFSLVDLQTRTALSAEQIPFVIDVFRFDPVGVLASVVKNSVKQFATVGIDEFFPNAQQVASFKSKLPEPYAERLMNSPIIFRGWVRSAGNLFYSSLYFASIAALLIVLLCRSIVSKSEATIVKEAQWTDLLILVLAGLVINAAICGALSEPSPRYQARIAWVPLFAFLLMLGKAAETYFASDLNDSEFLRRSAELLPRPLRFLCVGTIGLLTDLGSFTLFAAFGHHPLIARIGSVAFATLVTWRLNRTLTFDRSGRRQHEEAVRYFVVTLVAQGTSYLVFAALVLTILASAPQVAIIIGAAIGAIVSYNGHRLFAFAPQALSDSSRP